MRHWAQHLVGTDYDVVGGCWGLVRLVFRERLDVDMPEVSVGSESDQAAAILAASHASGWRPAEGAPREMDILLMRAPDGRRHVGIATAANGEAGMLHAAEQLGVQWRPLAMLRVDGYTDIECWRRP